MSEEIQPPKQERSRQLLERLLKSTIEILCEEGLDGATIPVIATRAAISPASVYRRFKDKDALLRAAFLRVIDLGGLSARHLLSPAVFRELSFEEAAAKIVGLLYMQYRGAPKLIKSINRFYEAETDERFRRDSLDGLKRNFANLARALLAIRELANSPGAERSVTLGLLAVTNSIETIVLDPDSLWSIIQPASDEEIQAELVRMLVSYVRSSP